MNEKKWTRQKAVIKIKKKGMRKGELSNLKKSFSEKESAKRFEREEVENEWEEVNARKSNN